MGFARLRKPTRPHPVAGNVKGRIVFPGPFVSRGFTRRVEVFAHRTPADCAQCNWCVGRPENCRSRFGDGFTSQLSHYCQSIDISSLTLVSAHAESCVAFEMLNRLVVLLICQLNVLNGHVVLLVNPSTALAMGHMIKWLEVIGAVNGARQLQCAGGDTQDFQCSQGFFRPAAQCVFSRKQAFGRPRHRHANRDVLAGDESCNTLIPDRPAALVAGQVDVGIPAARHTQGATG